MDHPSSNEHVVSPTSRVGEGTETFPRRWAAPESCSEPAPESVLDLINRVSRDHRRTDNVAKLIQASGKAIALTLIGISVGLGAGTFAFGQSSGVLILMGGVLISRAVTTAARNFTERRTSNLRRQKQ